MRFAAHCPGSTGYTGVSDNQVEWVAGVGSIDPFRRRLKVLYVDHLSIEGAATFFHVGGHVVKAIGVSTGQREKGVRPGKRVSECFSDTARCSGD